MTEFAVLRAPSQVLFGAGMAAAAGRVAAAHGRRVLRHHRPDDRRHARLRAPSSRPARGGPGRRGVRRRRGRRAVVRGRRRRRARPRDAPDVIVAVGGGSVIDLAKVTALLLAHGGALSDYYAVNSVPGPIVPLIALPTTAGTGSEATPVAVITDAATAMKIGVASPHLIPRHAICDPLLTSARRRRSPRTPASTRSRTRSRRTWRASETPSVELVLEPPAGRQERALRHARADRGGPHRREPRARRRGRRRSRGAHGDALRQPARRDRVRQLRRLAAHALQFAVGAATHTSHGLGTGLLLPYVMEYNRPARPHELAELARVMQSSTTTPLLRGHPRQGPCPDGLPDDHRHLLREQRALRHGDGGLRPGLRRPGGAGSRRARRRGEGRHAAGRAGV